MDTVDGPSSSALLSDDGVWTSGPSVHLKSPAKRFSSRRRDRWRGRGHRLFLARVQPLWKRQLGNISWREVSSG